MYRKLLLSLILFMVGTASCRSLHREERDVPMAASEMMASNRQMGMGLSALGTLVSPLLFLMGMGSFISMLPQMFQTVLSGVGSNLIQSFTGGSQSGGSSSRLKRNVEAHPLFDDNLLDEIERRINLAILQNERPNI